MLNSSDSLPNASESSSLRDRETSTTLDAIIASADSNADGQLSWEEFYACVVRENSKLRQLTELFDAVATDTHHLEAEIVSEADCKQS